jgi:hypothetical protein
VSPPKNLSSASFNAVAPGETLYSRSQHTTRQPQPGPGTATERVIS